MCCATFNILFSKFLIIFKFNSKDTFFFVNNALFRREIFRLEPLFPCFAPVVAQTATIRSLLPIRRQGCDRIDSSKRLRGEKFRRKLLLF